MEVHTSIYHITQEQITEELVMITKAKSDMACFAALYEKYYIRIFRFVYQRVDSENTAADITSQVFVNAMCRLKDYVFKGVPFGSWLYRIARNEVNQHFRKAHKERTYYANTEDFAGIADEIEEDRISEILPKMMEAVGRLDDDEIEMIEMKYFEQRPYKEIADIFGITENNAKVKTFRILKKLKKTIT